MFNQPLEESLIQGLKRAIQGRTLIRFSIGFSLRKECGWVSSSVKGDANWVVLVNEANNMHVLSAYRLKRRISSSRESFDLTNKDPSVGYSPCLTHLCRSRHAWYSVSLESLLIAPLPGLAKSMSRISQIPNIATRWISKLDDRSDRWLVLWSSVHHQRQWMLNFPLKKQRDIL